MAIVAPGGKLVDLVLRDRDPLARPASEIGETKVLQTFVSSERVDSA